jgi:hypothetical protein
LRNRRRAAQKGQTKQDGELLESGRFHC